MDGTMIALIIVAILLLVALIIMIILAVLLCKSKRSNSSDDFKTSGPSSSSYSTTPTTESDGVKGRGKPKRGLKPVPLSDGSSPEIRNKSYGNDSPSPGPPSGTGPGRDKAPGSDLKHGSHGSDGSDPPGGMSPANQSLVVRQPSPDGSSRSSMTPPSSRSSSSSSGSPPPTRSLPSKNQPKAQSNKHPIPIAQSGTSLLLEYPHLPPDPNQPTVKDAPEGPAQVIAISNPNPGKPVKRKKSKESLPKSQTRPVVIISNPNPGKPVTKRKSKESLPKSQPAASKVPTGPLVTRKVSPPKKVASPPRSPPPQPQIPPPPPPPPARADGSKVAKRGSSGPVILFQNPDSDFATVDPQDKEDELYESRPFESEVPPEVSLSQPAPLVTVVPAHGPVERTPTGPIHDPSRKPVVTVVQVEPKPMSPVRPQMTPDATVVGGAKRSKSPRRKRRRKRSKSRRSKSRKSKSRRSRSRDRYGRWSRSRSRNRAHKSRSRSHPSRK